MGSVKQLEYNQTNQSAAWRNPDSGHSGTITPTGGEEHNAYGRAFRRPDGSWQIVK
jgi:surface antigen